jgi:hypothetical protein
MAEATFSSLRDRIERLERENRRIKSIAVFVALSVAAVALMGQGPSRPSAKHIEAERFVLLDTTGKARAFLGFGQDGEPMLSFRDVKGTPRAHFGVRDDGAPVVLFTDQAGKLRLQLLVGPSGAPAMVLSHEDGRPGAVLTLRAPGVPVLGFVDRNGAPRAELMLLGSTGDPSARFKDKDGKVTWKAP